MSFISAMPLIETNTIDLLPALFRHVTTKEVTIQEKKNRITKKRLVCMRQTGRKGEEDRRAGELVLLVIIRLKRRTKV